MVAGFKGLAIKARFLKDSWVSEAVIPTLLRARKATSRKIYHRTHKSYVAGCEIRKLHPFKYVVSRSLTFLPKFGILAMGTTKGQFSTLVVLKPCFFTLFGAYFCSRLYTPSSQVPFVNTGLQFDVVSFTETILWTVLWLSISSFFLRNLCSCYYYFNKKSVGMAFLSSKELFFDTLLWWGDSSTLADIFVEGCLKFSSYSGHCFVVFFFQASVTGGKSPSHIRGGLSC